MQFNKSMSVNCYYVNPQRKLFLKRVISKKKRCNIIGIINDYKHRGLEWWYTNNQRLIINPLVEVEIKQVHQVLLAQNTQCYIMCL